MVRRVTLTESFLNFEQALEFVYIQTQSQDPIEVEIREINNLYRVGIIFEYVVTQDEVEEEESE